MSTIWDALSTDEAPAKTPKRRRVDEYTLKLSPQQWRILEALANGAALSAPGKSLCMLTWQGVHVDYCARSTAASLVKRQLIALHQGYYHLVEPGRHALRIREQNKPGQL